MRSICVVSLFAVFAGMLLVAQSNRSPIGNQPNVLTVAQEPHSGGSTIVSRGQEQPFAQQRAGTLRRTAAQQDGLPEAVLSFAKAVDYGSGGNWALAGAVGDVNGDGKPDIVVANLLSSNIGVLLGNGDGTFQTAVSYDSGGSFAHGVAVADVNGDGKLDVLVANDNGGNSNGAIGVLLGNGDGTFQTAVPYDSGGFQAYSVAVGDVNGDGKPDLVVGNCSKAESDGCSTSSSGEVSVLLGNGDGTFQPAVSYDLGLGSATSVVLGDLNGDGKPDIVVANYSNSVSVLLGNGDGTFQTAVSYNSGGGSTFSVVLLDVNDDGKLDVVAANNGGNNIGVLLGNGDGSFQPAVTYNTGGSSPWSLAVADVNGDKKLDVLVVNGGSNNVAVLLGNDDGTFQKAVTYETGGSNPMSIADADFNGDGKPDLAVMSCGVDGCGDLGVVSVLINTSRVATTTVLVSSHNPSNFGQAVTFTATVTPQGEGTPTGTVSFFDGTANIGNSPLNGSGVAKLTISTLTVGTHKIKAAYSGDATFRASHSPVLHQVVQGAIAVLSPTSLNFGKETVGITSASQFTVLTNTGNIALAIKSIEVTGANSSDFAEKNNCGSSVPPKGQCKINVRFTPAAKGRRTAVVSITDNAPDSPQTVSLIGVGVLPAVMFSPTSLTFPTQLIFTTSPAQPVQLTNTGPGTLIINKIVVGKEFIQTNNCPRSIAPGASCTIDVKFHPKNKGLLEATLSVIDNAHNSPQKVPLRGMATLIKLTPTKLNFGTQPVGTKSLPKRIAVTNKGDSAVTIAKISITGADAGDFAQTNNCGKQLPSGASCLVKVTFKPALKGKRTADVSVYDDGGASPQEAELTGTGT